MAKLSFKYIPLTFISSQKEIQRQIRNTIVFSYLNNKYNDVREFSEILVSTQYGLNAAANDSGQHKFLRISDIKEGEVNWDSVPFCDCKDEKTYKLFKNDILVARTGGTTGKSFLIKSPPSNAVFAGYLIRLRAKEDISPELIYEFLNSYAYWSQISEMKMGSAQPNVNAQKLKKLKIPLAPKRVLEQVSNLLLGKQSNLPELESLIEKGMLGYNTSQNVTNLFVEQKDIILNLGQSILQEAVEGRLTAGWRASNPNIEDASTLLKRIHEEKVQLIKDKKIKKEKALPPISKDEIPYDLPEGWVWCRLGTVTDIIAGASFKSGDFNETGGVKCIKITNAGVRNFVETDDFLPKGFDELYPNYLIKEGDLILALTRPYIKDGLKISICPRTYNNSLLNQRVASIRSLTNKIYHPYIFSFIQSPKVLNYYKSKFDGKSQQPNMKMGDITNLLISLPPIEEQKAIVNKVNALMGLCDTLEQVIQQSQEHSAQLMQSCLREVFENNITI